MAITKIQSESLNLSDNYDFTGTVTGAGGVNTPAFVAVRTTTLDIANGIWVKVSFDSVILDTDSCYDSSTNYRFTPTTAGYYLFNLNLSFQNYIESKYLAIRKNGTLVSNLGMAINNSSNISTIAQANGTSDYFEAYVAHVAGSSQTIDFSETRNQFSAIKIIE